jgi:hypothetical protein
MNIPKKACLTSTHTDQNFIKRVLAHIIPTILTGAWDFVEASDVKEVVLLLAQGASDVLEGCESLSSLVEEIVHLPAVGLLESDISIVSSVSALSLSLGCSTTHDFNINYYSDTALSLTLT